MAFRIFIFGLCIALTSGCAKPVADEEKILSEVKSALTAWSLGEGMFDYGKRMGKHRDARAQDYEWMDGAVLLNFELKGIRECPPLKMPHPRQVPGTKTFKITTVLTFQSKAKTEIKEQRIFVAERLQFPKDSPTSSGEPWNPTEDDLKPYWEIRKLYGYE